MKKPPKTHLWDTKHESKITFTDINKLNGYRATACGYQRKNASFDPKEVNCKLCINEMQKKGKNC